MSRAMANEIYGVKPLDPLLIASVVSLLGVVALAACVMPALRAVRVDPVVVLSEQ